MNVDTGTAGTSGIDAAAEALFENDPVSVWRTWGTLTETDKTFYRCRAQVAIDAYLRFYYGETESC